jgi:hypothetical protein
VHFFRNFHAEMSARGHELLVTVRAKEFSVELLERSGLPYRLISVQRAGALGLAREMLERSYRLMGIVREFRADVLTGIMGPSIALVGKLLRVPAVIFYDTEFARQTNRFAYPLAHSVCTPDCYQEKVRGRHITYAGYHELAYLHPIRFTPDPARLPAFGVREGERYVLLRFVSWKASHDKGEVGLTDDRKRRLVDLLSAHGKVLISSEGPVPREIEPLLLRGPLEDVHHLLAYAQMIVGESATMASEAAVLGVPAVFIATTSRGYIDDQERRYGHVRHFTEDEFEQAMDSIGGLLTSGPREVGSAARARLLADKIDVTGWMVEYIEREFA